MNARQKQLLIMLLKAKGYLSGTQLAQELGCSEKTIRNDLKELDNWIECHESAVQIVRKPSLGVVVEGTTTEKEHLLAHLPSVDEDDLSQDRRKLETLKLLLTTDKLVTMNQIAEKLYISKSTVNQDLTHIERSIQDFSLHMIRKPNLGIRVQGPEEGWRNALSKVVEHMANHPAYPITPEQLKMLEDVLHPYELALIEREIRRLEQVLDFPFTDQAITSLTIHLAIAIKRFKKGHSIQMPEQQLEQLKGKKEFSFAKQLAEALEKWLAVKIPDDEVGYMTLHFLGARLRVDQIVLKEGLESSLEKIDQESLTFVKLLLKHVSQTIDARIEQDQELLIGLGIHFHATLNRLRHGLSISNPMIKEIKQMYRYVFEVLLSFMPEIERKVGIAIPEDEVAYLVLHFQASLERLQCLNRVKRRALIVCASGASTSLLLEAKLSSLFPQLEIVGVSAAFQIQQKVKELQPEVVISTLPVEVGRVPLMIVSPLLPKYEQKRLEEFLQHVSTPSQNQESRYKVLREYIMQDQELVFIDPPCLERLAIIDFLAEKLYQKGCVEEAYGRLAKERERLSSTYIGGGIAIPHSKVELIKKPAIAVAKLKKQADWGGDSVGVVFMLAHNLQDPEKVKKLFQELSTLSEDEEVLEQLKRVTSLRIS
ncbi:BglG family transcription antiterminator [Caldalkalibacillus mannanilyticus]|uniref:BglG family transcription antiterminator n=1 Tax=Caldalkalibacillus mannanilyticus TaxID=1418 RepID=UPI0004697F4F|nr:BglG family transcription antiterminator [Caldalkalibacillus mannanilyticus]